MEWIVILLFAFSEERNRAYKTKMKERYKYDDRWEEIQNKANKIINRYYDFLLSSVTIGALIAASISFKVGMTAELVSFLGFLGFGIKNIFEIIALHYFESNL